MRIKKIVFSFILFLAFSFLSNKPQAACVLTATPTYGPSGQVFQFNFFGCVPNQQYNFGIDNPLGVEVFSGIVNANEQGAGSFSTRSLGNAGPYTVYIMNYGDYRTTDPISASTTVIVTSNIPITRCGQIISGDINTDTTDTMCPLSCPRVLVASQYRCSTLRTGSPCTENSQCTSNYCIPQEPNSPVKYCSTSPPTPTPVPQVVPNGVCGRDTYDRRLTFCSLAQIFNNGTAPYGGCGLGEQCFIGFDSGEAECNWGVQDNLLLMCFNGSNPQDIQNTRIDFQCVGDTCGGLLTNALMRLDGRNIQRINGPWPLGESRPGNYYSCGGGNLSSEIGASVRRQIDLGSLGCGLTGAAEFTGSLVIPAIAAGRALQGINLVGRLAISGAAGTAGGVAGGGLAAVTVQPCLDAINRYRPTIEARIIRNGNAICTRQLTLNVDATYEITTTGQDFDSLPEGTVVGESPISGTIFRIVPCVIGSPNSTSEVVRDNVTEGIQTAIGCIPTTPGGLARKLFQVAIGFAGGIAFLLILFGGLRIMLTRGEPKALQEAQELITSAIVGLVLIILSVFILRFLGFNLLGIPGFG